MGGGRGIRTPKKRKDRRLKGVKNHRSILFLNQFHSLAPKQQGICSKVTKKQKKIRNFTELCGRTVFYDFIAKSRHDILTKKLQSYMLLEHCIPRLCNGSTSDSGSDCGGSNPPWGTDSWTNRSAFFINGSFEYRFSSSPSQGGETGSTPVGAIF